MIMIIMIMIIMLIMIIMIITIIMMVMFIVIIVRSCEDASLHHPPPHLAPLFFPPTAPASDLALGVFIYCMLNF